MENSRKIDPFGFREYDARWLYDKNINLLGIIFFGKKELETLETIKFFGKKILKKNIKILGRLPVAKELSKNTIQAFTKKIEI